MNTTIKSAVTVSLVEEARGGPFVYWQGVADAARCAAELGFDALEVFAPAAEAIDVVEMQTLGDQHGLQIAAFGTGGGMVKHGLSLTSPDAHVRERARQFIIAFVRLGATFNAPAIIGSMQGRSTAEVSRQQALDWLAAALNDIGRVAGELGVPLLFEPLNRYESNLFNTLEATCEFMRTLEPSPVRILADLFHMQIEEANSATALRKCADLLGHIHFADSNRRAVGLGQSDLAPIAEALLEMQYAGYVSAEVFPLPDSDTAARTTIEAFQKLFRQR